MMPFLINVLILAMLGATMLYALVLSRRVERLMAVLTEMEPLVQEFSAAVDKSESSVGQLKSAALEAMSSFASMVTPPAERDAAGAEMESPATFVSRRRKPVAGMTRISGKSDLVKSFFDRTRSLGEAAGEW